MEAGTIAIGETITEEELNKLSGPVSIGETITAKEFEKIPVTEKEGWAWPATKETLKSIPRVAGALAGGIAAFAPSGLAGYVRLLQAGPEESIKMIEYIQGLPMKLIKTPEQEKAMEYLLKPIEVITESAKWWGDKAEKKWGWQAGAIVASGIEAATFLALPKLKIKLTKLVKAGKLAEARKLALDLHKQRLQKLKAEPRRLKKLAEAEKEVARKEGLKGEPLTKPTEEHGKPYRAPEAEATITPKETQPLTKQIKEAEILGRLTHREPEAIARRLAVDEFRKKKGLPPLEKVPIEELKQRQLKMKRAAMEATRKKEEDLSMLGTQQIYEAIVKDLPRLRDASKEVFRAITNPWDVERQFKKIGAAETGYHAKAFFSQQAMHEEFGLWKASEVAQLTKHSKIDLQKIPLLYESPKTFASLPKSERNRLKPAVEEFGKYFEDSLKEYKAKGGLERGFKERIVSELEELLTKDISEADRAGLVQTLKDAKEMNFVHIPSALWFESKLGTDPVGAQKVLRLLVKQKRKTFKIQDLIDNEIIKPEQVNAVDIIASYARRKGRDFAVLNLKDAALKDGLASKKQKEGYVKLPTYRAPALADTYLHPMLADYIGHELLGKGLDLGRINKWMSLSKMSAFINPIILPMYDTVQMTMASGIKPYKVPVQLYRGYKLYRTKPKAYWEALDNGLASKPYNNPFQTYKSLMEWAKKNKRDKVVAALETVYPQNTIKNMYNTSWHIAWELDKMVRMGTYDMLIKKGFKSREAAQIAAKFHSDYASVPPSIRRMLNIPFFTPTFKITMGKLYIQMVTDAVRSSVKLGGLLGKVDPKTATFAKGLLATAAVDEGFHIFMLGLGFKRDEWGRRYKRKVMTKEGEKELVTTWSAPSNMFLKYIYRALAAIKPDVEKPMLRFFETNKWEIHPIWRVGYELVTNERGDGEEIVNENDNFWVKQAKRTRYGVTHVIRLLGMLDKDKNDKEARKQFTKEVGQLWELITYPVTFKYLRTPEGRRKMGKVKALQRRFYQSLRKGNFEAQHFEVFREKIDEILKEK